MAPYLRYGENETGERRRLYPPKFGKERELTKWQQKHRVLTVPSTMNNYTDIHYIYDLDEPHLNFTVNGTAAMLNNNFYRKKLLLGDMSARRSVGAQPLTTVIVIASIFLFITMSITAATVVFCKKKNTVFVLNKSEQDENDYDLELEELDNTDVDFVEFNEDIDLSKLEHQPSCSRGRYLDERVACKYEQDGYRRMVVAAVVEHETPLKSGFYKTSSNSESDLSASGTPIQGTSKSKPPSSNIEQINSTRYHHPMGDNPNVKELLRRLPLGAQTIQYINGKRYLVCELPETIITPKTDKDDSNDLLQTGIDIQPDMSSIQGEVSPNRCNPNTSFQESEDELICDGLNDPYLSLGMSHSQSMGVIMNPNHDHSLRTSMSTDFNSGPISWKH